VAQKKDIFQEREFNHNGIVLRFFPEFPVRPPNPAKCENSYTPLFPLEWPSELCRWSGNHILIMRNYFCISAPEEWTLNVWSTLWF